MVNHYGISNLSALLKYKHVQPEEPPSALLEPWQTAPTKQDDKKKKVQWPFTSPLKNCCFNATPKFMIILHHLGKHTETRRLVTKGF